MAEWKEQDNALVAEWVFEDFSQAFAFMSQVAMAAERAGHHPDWRNVWNKVSLRLSTHDAGHVVTDKDRALAGEISRIAKSYGR